VSLSVADVRTTRSGPVTALAETSPYDVYFFDFGHGFRMAATFVSAFFT
jgi:hypothetical protein